LIKLSSYLQEAPPPAELLSSIKASESRKFEILKLTKRSGHGDSNAVEIPARTATEAEHVIDIESQSCCIA